MQPYQEASEQTQRQQSAPADFLRSVGKTAIGLAGGSVFAKKVAPLLSQYIPEELAIKGLSKISPRMGKFIQGAMDQGKSFDEVKSFIGGKVEDANQPAAAQQKLNIVEQHSPELHQFILNETKKGSGALQAATKATMDKVMGSKFTKILEKISKDYKVPWHNLIESIYGQGNSSKQQALQKFNQHKQGLLDQEAERFSQEYGQQQPSQQMQQPQQSQPGQGLDPAVAQILQQGAAILQKFKAQQ